MPASLCVFWGGEGHILSKNSRGSYMRPPHTSVGQWNQEPIESPAEVREVPGNDTRQSPPSAGAGAP